MSLSLYHNFSNSHMFPGCFSKTFQAITDNMGSNGYPFVVSLSEFKGLGHYFITDAEYISLTLQIASEPKLQF